MTEHERLTNSDKEIPTLNDNAEYWLQVYFKLKDYEEIGTIEEFKALKEKSAAKKPFQPFGTHSYKCSNCWQFVAHEVDDNCDLSSLAEWCPYCGSRIDWSE